ncbi:MAG: hypothetical protein ACMG6E_07645 [Candidatus Roizmanbacteria bacterium]
MEEEKNKQTQNFFMGLIDKNKNKNNAQGNANAASVLKRGSVMPGKPLEGLNGIDALGSRSSQPSRNEAALNALKDRHSKNSVGTKEEVKAEDE